MKERYVPRGDVYAKLNEPGRCCYEIALINCFVRDSLSKGIRRLEDIENAMKTIDSPMYKFYEMAMLRADVRMEKVRDKMFLGIVVRGEGCYIV